MRENGKRKYSIGGIAFLFILFTAIVSVLIMSIVGLREAFFEWSVSHSISLGFVAILLALAICWLSIVTWVFLGQFGRWLTSIRRKNSNGPGDL
jgi:hypothetical protein